MKGKRIVWSGLLVVLAITFFLTSAHAQIPDLWRWENTWFRVNTSQSGQAFDGGRMLRENMRGVSYLYIGSQENGILRAVFYVQEGGVWEAVPVQINILGGTESDFLCYVEIEITDDIGPTFTGFTARATTRTMRGVTRPASIKSLGGYYWEVEEGLVAAGSISINASFISEPPPGLPINNGPNGPA